MKKLFQGVFGSLQKTIFAVILVMIMIPTTVLGTIAYTQYRKNITEHVEALNQGNASQMAWNIQGILKNVQNSSLSFYQNQMVRTFLLADSEKELEAAWYSLNRFILNQIAYEEYIYAVEFIRMDGQRYSSSSVMRGLDEKEKRELLDRHGGPVFYTDIQAADRKDGGFYGYARCIYDINDIGRPIGFQQIYIEKKEIQQLMDSDRSEGEEYYIVENGTIIISTVPEAEGSKLDMVFPNMTLKEGGSRREALPEGEVVLACAKAAYPEWYIIKQIPLKEISGKTEVIRQLLISSGIFAVCICAAAGFFLSKFVLHPLKELEASMEHIEENHFKQKLAEGGYEEIGGLAKEFNRMSKRLDELVNQVYLAKIREKEAQIRALQAYINPHFLYNTLDTICWMSRMEQAGETSRLIEALSKLFRASVKDDRKTITVEEELEQVGNYIMIQECRHTDSIDFFTEVQEQAKGCETVRLVLQPLVENAIIHGLEPTGEPGRIWIRIYIEDERLVMAVENEGREVKAEEMEEWLWGRREGQRGLGLSNVNDRIRLCYGEEYGMYFEARKAGGLIVRVEQPLIFGKGEGNTGRGTCND